MPTVYEIMEQYRQFDDQLELMIHGNEEVPVLSEEEIQRIYGELSAEVDARLGYLCSARANRKHLVKSLKEEIQRLQKKQRSQERAIEWIEHMLKQEVKVVGKVTKSGGAGWKHADGLWTASVSGGSYKVDDPIDPTHESLAPFTETVVTYKTNKKALLEAWKSGQVFPGVQITEVEKLRVS